MAQDRPCPRHGLLRFGASFGQRQRDSGGVVWLVASMIWVGGNEG
jgi:hypothetical protein